MPREVRHFAVTIPKTTAVAAPYTHKLTINPLRVQSIRVRVPPGPMGTMGFAVGNAEKPVIPLGTGEYIVEDNWYTTFDLTTYTTSGTWWLIGYNTTVTNDHTVYLLFSMTPVVTTTPVTPVAVGTLSSTGPVGATGVPITAPPTPGRQAATTGAAVTGVPPLTPAPTVPPPTLPAPTLPTAPTLPAPTLPPASTLG